MNHGTVYAIFRNDPAKAQSSYLANYYKQGLLGINKPSIGKPLAHAAWRAGYDTARAAPPQTEGEG